ncbi:flagellar hook-basal body complex protein FliE [Mangrovibacillus cuniculi]|uniref:Flagellar hook-basal body complex protein FliE n=1 Tax=Mangrovibacillus cuniculi TaxID=2593652 RepID=A0A7S8HFE1_9BACI|nr:flagellar hook-basal body complex protein FliE [Mangrovibacillus cuniculi]QPC46340.1 flagellar hook-basal body complex protein FliE [Mangrovibacillus cuniculi]
MSIQNIPSFSLHALRPSNPTESVKISPGEAQAQFGAYLQNAIQNVNQNQIQSDVITNKMINGENIQLHDVMIASQKASITLQTTMEVRNKVVEAYQEIMRMQV